MFGQTRHARLINADLSDIERRMRALEKRLERIGGAAGRTSSSVSSSVTQATDRVGEAVGAALAEVAGHFRGGARSVGGEAVRFGQVAARYGNDALRRLSHEVEHRPFLILAVAAGIGLLVGISGRRH